MNPADLVAVVDVGKTNAKLSLIDAGSGEIVRATRRPNEVLAAPPVRQLDVKEIERWLLRELAAAPHKERIRHIVPVAHGAAAVLVDGSGDVILAPDYEDPAFEATRGGYARERDEFAATFSPHLPLGLNLGAQLHFLESAHAQSFRRAAGILLLPQYFAWRFSGVMASEVTSLGCHTDLWRPLAQDFSAMARRRAWASLLPPMRAARDVLGRIRPELARSTGLDPGCEVLCGIHDSNASYLTHLCRRRPGSPFAVVSSGTWTIAMASGVDITRLRQERDMLANVDAFGSPVGTARFMGGREYQAVAGAHGMEATPTRAAMERVLGRRAMAFPGFANTGGPFQGREGRLVGADGLDGTERAALATLYVALVTDFMLDLLGAGGDLVIDGPLAGNPLFAPVMGGLRPESRVTLSDAAGGLASGGLVLATGARREERAGQAGRVVEPLEIEGLPGYRAQWRESAPSPRDRA